MILSVALRRYLKNNLNDTPLQDAEVRRIEGLGSLFISMAAPETITSKGYEFLYSYRIGGKSYNFYSLLVTKDQAQA